MANVTFEQALAVVQSLPYDEKRRLLQWLSNEEQNLVAPPVLPTAASSFRVAEMQWLREHEAQYAGQWLALDGGRLLSHGPDPHQVRAEARAQGVDSPFVVFAENPEEFSTGGWL